jgi:hypothetical protein
MLERSGRAVVISKAASHWGRKSSALFIYGEGRQMHPTRAAIIIALTVSMTSALYFVAASAAQTKQSETPQDENPFAPINATYKNGTIETIRREYSASFGRVISDDYLKVTCDLNFESCRESTNELPQYLVQLDESDTDASGNRSFLVEFLWRPLPLGHDALADMELAGIEKKLTEVHKTNEPIVRSSLVPMRYRISGIPGRHTLRVPYDYTDPQGHVAHMEATYGMPTWNDKEPAPDPYSVK